MTDCIAHACAVCCICYLKESHTPDCPALETFTRKTKRTETHGTFVGVIERCTCKEMMMTYTPGMKLRYYGYDKKHKGSGIPCRVVEKLPDGRFLIRRADRHTKVSEKTLDREYVIDVADLENDAGLRADFDSRDLEK